MKLSSRWSHHFIFSLNPLFKSPLYQIQFNAPWPPLRRLLKPYRHQKKKSLSSWWWRVNIVIAWFNVYIKKNIWTWKHVSTLNELFLLENSVNNKNFLEKFVKFSELNKKIQIKYKPVAWHEWNETNHILIRIMFLLHIQQNFI